MATAAEAELADVLQRTEALQARVETESQLAATVLPPLPSDAVELIFLLVPVHLRLRCREVARSWRALLERRRLWRDCDLSAVPSELRTPALLRAASLRAGGQLRTLNVSGWGDHGEEVLEVVRENSALLLELRMKFFGEHGFPEREDLEALLGAAPQLRLLECDLLAQPDALHPMLLNEPPFGPLRLGCLHIIDVEVLNAAFAEQIAAHPSLTELVLDSVLLDAASANTVADAVVAGRLSKLELFYCEIPAEVLPAMSRLLSTGSLAVLTIECVGGCLLFDDHSALSPFCESFRPASLTKLSLQHCALFYPLWSGLSILSSCTAHSSLKKLELSGNELESNEARTAAGILLAQILASSPALESLEVSCTLHDQGMRPLFAALARSTTLRSLYCYDARVSAECARDCILPAVQANTSLRRLVLDDRIPELQQAVALVKTRAGAA
jgi:hypothetical protein